MQTTATDSEIKKAVGAPAGRNIAYLLSCYPAVSHTFFLNEISELRKLGFHIHVASINTPEWPSGTAPEREAAEMQATHYIKATRPVRIATVLLKVLLLQPAVFFRGLRAALQL